MTWRRFGCVCKLCPGQYWTVIYIQCVDSVNRKQVWQRVGSIIRSAGLIIRLFVPPVLSYLSLLLFCDTLINTVKQPPYPPRGSLFDHPTSFHFPLVSCRFLRRPRLLSTFFIPFFLTQPLSVVVPATRFRDVDTWCFIIVLWLDPI